jgi:hypothetical protein
MVNRDIIKTTLSMKKLQRMNNQLKEQLKQEKTTSRVRQMRIEDLEKKLLRIRDNATDEEPIHELITSKDNEIIILKRQLKMIDLDHVQTPKIMAIQKEKEQLLNVIAQLNEQVKFLQQQIEVLKQGISSSSTIASSTNNLEELAKTLVDLDLKEIELKK